MITYILHTFDIVPEGEELPDPDAFLSGIIS